MGNCMQRESQVDFKVKDSNKPVNKTVVKLSEPRGLNYSDESTA